MTGWRFWIELLVRSGVLIAAGLVLRRFSARMGAAFRHRLLIWIFVLLALLPVLAAVCPEISLMPWTRSRELRATVTAEEVSARTVEVPVRRAVPWLLIIWVSGVGVALFPLVAGALSVTQMRRKARLLRVAGDGRVLVSDELTVPVTCGIFRPRILLPASANTWSDARLEMVLLHERAHIERRDLTAQIMAHLISALWWFQPLVWMLRRELRAESELACDAAVLGRGVKASAYAGELLEIARELKGRLSLSSSAVAMVRAGDLEQRLKELLRSQGAVMAGRVKWTMFAGLALISLLASAGNLQSGEASGELGGSMMKRTILSALLSSAGLSAASISGYVHDTSGAAVADAKVTMLDPDSSAKQETTTGADGRFSFDGANGGQYILRIEKPGLASIFRVFEVKTESKVDRDFTMTSEGSATVADTSIVAEDMASKPIRVGGQIAQSNLVTKVQPVYPVEAKKARVQGTVEILARISKDGVPVSLSVTSSPNDDLSESAVEAVRQWRYRPTLLNGQPVDIETTVIVNYTLSR